jgi:hypothetical protein
MNTDENTTAKTKKNSLSKSTQAGMPEIRPEDSQNLSTILDAGSLDTMSLLDTSAQRLSNLMHSQMEQAEKDYLEDRPVDLKYEQVDKIVELAKEVRETIKLKVEIVRLKKDIIKDLRRN